MKDDWDVPNLREEESPSFRIGLYGAVVGLRVGERTRLRELLEPWIAAAVLEERPKRPIEPVEESWAT